jgi:spore coat protein A
VWPVLEVEPRQYRFRILNGSDSRFYDLFFSSGQPFHQIGTDTGLLAAPVMTNRVLIAPGERVDTVVDFSDPALAGQTIIMRNNARSPFPKGATVNPRTTGQIMAFRVTRPLDPAYPRSNVNAPAASPTPLRPLLGPIAPLTQTGATRQLLLFEGIDPMGRLIAQLGTATDGAMMWHDATYGITENPMLNDVEVWEIYNSTPDAHPIHLHLVSFQVLGRQKFSATQDPATGALTNIRLQGKQGKPALATEAGWKDTVIMYPGEVTRIIAKFDREGEYVWHCHILSHEDHEMMRPYFVGAIPADHPLDQTTPMP